MSAALPDVVGSVILINRWGGYSEDWTALLTAKGWRISVDSNAVYSGADLLASTKHDGFKVLYEPTPPLPTEPGLYVPANNKDMLEHTWVYRLSGNDTWYVGFGGHTGSSARSAEASALDAHKRLGGLVKLGAV